MGLFAFGSGVAVSEVEAYRREGRVREVGIEEVAAGKGKLLVLVEDLALYLTASL